MPYNALRPVFGVDMNLWATRNAATAPELGSGLVPLTVRDQPEDRFAFESLTEAAEWRLDELTVTFEPDDRIVWQYMQPIERPSFTQGLLRDMNLVADAVQGAFERGDPRAQKPLQFIVTTSKISESSISAAI